MTEQHHANPVGTDGFACLEFASNRPEALRQLFSGLGFIKIGQHADKDVELWRQNDTYFIVNVETKSSASEFSNAHGPSVSGMGFRVDNAKQALTHCLKMGASDFPANEHDWYCKTVPCIRGIGDNALFFIDSDAFFTEHFVIDQAANQKAQKTDIGLLEIDHVTHNVHQGNMDKWAKFYEDLFNFREIRYFDIKGKQTGLFSRAMTGPCNKLRIPINESADDKSQIAEYLREYNGEGIQHIALTTNDIYQTVERLRELGTVFMDTPDTYYEQIEQRLPGHKEPVARMQKNKVLIDGHPEDGILLQIFTDTVIGPVFFEIIQRKGDEGFGEGNFQALFDSIELDQVRRGVLSDDT